MALRRPIKSVVYGFALAVMVAGVTSCTSTALNNLLAPAANFSSALGGIQTPRALQIGFINNTPFRAICTYGSYDQLDQDTIPHFAALRLEGYSSSTQLTRACRSSFSVGGGELIHLIEANENSSSVSITDPLALVDGVNFSGAPSGDPLESEPTEGTAQGITLLNGVDYTCRRANIDATTGSGLLLFTFEQDATAPGGFRIDYMFIEP